MITRRHFLRLGTVCSASLVAASISECKKINTADWGNKSKLNDSGINITGLDFDKQFYGAGDTVKVSFRMTNNSSSNIKVKGVKIIVYTTTTILSQSFDLAGLGLPDLAEGAVYTATGIELWNIPEVSTAPAVFYVYIGAILEDNSTTGLAYKGFFRVTTPGQLVTYSIQSESCEGLQIFVLNGGLSAEYCVEKSAEVLTGGVSHSWLTSAPGSGPFPVYSTPDFLYSSIKYTVDFYDQLLGSGTIIDTVILSTGVASMPYLSCVMNAPVLPVQFLVSVNSIKEVVGMLQHNKEISGISSYCTVGYDSSIKPAIAWVKLLQLPQLYIDFLNRHQVRNIIIAGVYGVDTADETTAKKILYQPANTSGYNNGDIFLMFPGGGTATDTMNLTAKIVDLDEYSSFMESNYRSVADWESGIVDEQINSFSSDVRLKTSIGSCRRLSATNSISMYNLATYLALTFMKANNALLAVNGGGITGIVLNPYLVSHPVFEVANGYLPILYWQGNNINDDFDRLMLTMAPAISDYFPGTDLTKLPFQLNTSRNFGGYQGADLATALESQGFNPIKIGDPGIDEVWDPSDGMNSICEFVAEEIIARWSAADFGAMAKKLTALSIADIDSLAVRHNDISVVEL